MATTGITTIEDLVECFENAEDSKQASVLKRIQIPIEDFEEFATWKEGEYTRNCVARRDGFEFILLCWSPGAITPIHGHDGQNCWVYQVSGHVRERRYTSASDGFNLSNDAIVDPGKLCYMHDRMGYHTIANESEKRAMTLHVYANPIDRCLVFNEEKQRFETVEMEYDTIEGNIVRPTGS
jgi:cysteine dioxygenase